MIGRDFMTFEEFNNRLNVNGFDVIRDNNAPRYYDIFSYKSGGCVAMVDRNASGNVMFHGEIPVRIAKIILMFVETPINKRNNSNNAIANKLINIAKLLMRNSEGNEM